MKQRLSFIAIGIAGIYLASWAVGQHPEAWWSFPTAFVGAAMLITSWVTIMANLDRGI